MLPCAWFLVPSSTLAQCHELGHVTGEGISPAPCWPGQLLCRVRTVVEPWEMVGHALAGHAVHGWWGQRTYSDTQDDQEIPPWGFPWAGRGGPLRLVSPLALSQLLAWQDAEPMSGWVGGWMLGAAHTGHTVWPPWRHGGGSGAHALAAWQMSPECGSWQNYNDLNCWNRHG